MKHIHSSHPPLHRHHSQCQTHRRHWLRQTLCSYHRHRLRQTLCIYHRLKILPLQMERKNHPQGLSLLRQLFQVQFFYWPFACFVCIEERLDRKEGMIKAMYHLIKQRDQILGTEAKQIGHGGVGGDENTSLLFHLETIVAYTNNCFEKNKLGGGGYGPVYMGKLQDGKMVAVKRLSSCSGQGLEAFKNEVILIAKLQHRNLVRLLECCLERQEKLLIYEYMPNKSLDTILFGLYPNSTLIS
ncbi:G-type lectin S-receptor-like serine/threonine-protein kinase CES101 [Amborella trichopoda]|uniref:G-type lectin S-receptor-like serine/threonine-protein kinase CES101 n=1 Tax=Amborella trichopoda TaxID=13333 RepID=UPI0009C0A754|nr:G-type lectin S-receptor-like serine/threonine-protein kinase CES101 [Amborella trichopoda]|eukprot:XP_020518072.1 G-type lectin S-receptor-like serine/threonine-protein kinase CES101 [Amborella trichopoda]